MKLLTFNGESPGLLRVVLGSLPFVLLAVLYLITSHNRLADNPRDKIFPSVSQIQAQVEKLALIPDPKTGQYLLWNDTRHSLKRLALGIVISALLGYVIGISMGMLPNVRMLFSPFVTFFSILPPIAVLPIIFLIAGVDEFAKVMLVVIGTISLITRDMYAFTRRLPVEYIVKSLSLGASHVDVIRYVVIPQTLPKLLDSMRSALGAAWIFLIVAEAIIASEGLGYRIFLVRRYLAMDIIIPYVIWLTFIGFVMDIGLRLIIKAFFPWYLADERR